MNATTQTAKSAPKASANRAKTAGRVLNDLKRDNSNTADAGTILKEMMRETERMEHGQARFTVFLFSGPATYNTSWYLHTFSEKGNKKAEIIDKVLTSFSPDYGILVHRATGSKKDVGRNEAASIEQDLARVKAIRTKFERAAMSAFYLLRTNAEDAKLLTSGGIQFRKNGVYDTMSNNAMSRNGSKLFAEAANKPKQSRGGKGAANNRVAMAESAKNITAYVTAKVKAIEEAPKGKEIEGFSAEEEEAFENLAITILAAKRADDGVITLTELNEFLSEKHAPFKVVNE